MSSQSYDDVVTGTSKVYDTRGKCSVPRQVRAKMDLKKGDYLKFVYADGEVYVKKYESDPLST